MKPVYKSDLPAHSQIWKHFQPGDFIDGYATSSPLSPQQAAKVGFSMPKWTQALLALRNIAMKPFGLKTETSGTGKGAIFPVQYEDDGEVLLGTDDRHLNFRIVLLQQAGTIYMGTWVHRNNRFGHLYLTLVMPFHVLITRNTMARIARYSAADNLS